MLWFAQAYFPLRVLIPLLYIFPSHGYSEGFFWLLLSLLLLLKDDCRVTSGWEAHSADCPKRVRSMQTVVRERRKDLPKWCSLYGGGYFSLF